MIFTWITLGICIGFVLAMCMFSAGPQDGDSA